MGASILLVDDHPIFLKGLCALLEDEADMSVVGEAGDGKSALKMIQQLSPDVVVMDITMPGLNGIDATKQIISDHPGIKVIALSIHSGKEFVEGMLKAGAIGYIVKESAPEELVKGIRAVMDGEAYLSPSITGLVVSQFRKPFLQTDNMDIIETKLFPPAVPEDHVHRTHLVEILERNRHLAIQNIIAPAGYGKSTLVACWLKEQSWPSAWLSLDKDDNDLHRFVAYFINAVHSVFPGALKESLALLHGAKLPPIQQLAGCLAIELDLIEHNFIIALDDVHLVREKKIHDLITEMFRHPPKSFHLIIIGRIDPFLPVAKFRALGQLEDIRMPDLRFTYEETETFANQIIEKAPEKQLIKELWKKTEGWITGIRLAALSVRHQSDFGSILSGLHGSPEYVMEYLFSEVLSLQSPQIRDSLIKTSILDRFCTPLCHAVLSNPSDMDSKKDEADTRQFIELLKKENMFIIRLDTSKEWFRYHQLFQQLLQQHLKKEMSGEKIAFLHLQAARWFDEKGSVDEAIHHALASGNPGFAAQIIEKNRMSTIDQDKINILKDWLKQLPSRIKKSRPGLLLGNAWVLFEHTRIAEISPIIEQVERIIDKKTSNPVLMSEIWFFKGLIHYFQENSSQSADCFITATDLYPQDTFMVLKAELEYWSCMALHLNGRKDIALQKLHENIRKRDIQEGILLSRLTFALCFIHILEGEFLQAVQENLRMKDVCRANKLVFADIWSFFIQGNAALQMVDLKTAEQRFNHVVENRYIISPRAALDAMAGLAISRQFMGRPGNEIDEIVPLALEYAEWSNDPSFFEIIRSWQARIALLRGDLESAVKWQRSLIKTSGNMMMLFFLEIPVVTECRVLVAEQTAGSLKESVERLDTLCQKTLAWHNTYHRMQCMVLLAVAKYHQGQTDEGLSILEKAVHLAVSGDWMLPFVELGKPMAEMIKQLQIKNIAKATVSKILAALNMYENQGLSPMSRPGAPRELIVTRTGVQPLIEPLTTREMEILILLAQHLYNKEIAEKLFISTETVKTHLKRIYEKLDVGSRRNAVIKAREIGLITDR